MPGRRRRTDEDDTAAAIALCARIHPYPARVDRLARASAIDGDTLPERTNAHGLTPPVGTHLDAAGIVITSPLRERLRTRRLQRADAARVRTATLVEILKYARAWLGHVWMPAGTVRHLARKRAVRLLAPADRQSRVGAARRAAS